MGDLRVNRWPEHIDAIIRMPQQVSGQDGHCGNFNLNASDDSKELILQRVSPVSASESMFSPVLPEINRPVVKEVSLSDCEPSTLEAGHAACEADLAAEGLVATEDLLEPCIFDYCFAGEEFAAMDAIVEHSSHELQQDDWE